ncbi:YheC/YheD family protein [Bacillus sp. CECT 9360]|uniref:YheC/YheD family endospore coat-associated protein n=1 Tax=Bacillus sp. CECT 9360 TaxID=2845821 RepID=UPI001E4C2ED2|nr:YheC/YheD family protein [Bacillus sp. CECT 9360]CAH0345374.1 Endospore coat-associated protein YheD [Bacillus sp. CECT 9360]
MEESTNYLGILATPKPTTPPFSRVEYYQFLSVEGSKRGLPVYIFLPDQVSYQKKTIIGYRYSLENSWEKSRLPLPSVVYDCLWDRMRYQSQVKWLKSQPGITFLNQILVDKIKIFDTLLQYEEWAAYLPPTKSITSIQVIADMLHEYGSIIIKPVHSAGGKGVIKIISKQDFHLAEGRDLKNHIFRKKFPNRIGLYQWIRKLTKVKMLVQPYLEFSTPEGSPYDIRILVKKDKKGEWVETGRAVRSGVLNGLTSNISGGGAAYAVMPFLERLFDLEQRMIIEEKLSYIVRNLPPFFESKHGRMVELGLDIGIDREGNVWIIEVNTKPGRESFRKIDNGDKYETALLSPLEYAQYLLTKK